MNTEFLYGLGFILSILSLIFARNMIAWLILATSSLILLGITNAIDNHHRLHRVASQEGT